MWSIRHVGTSLTMTPPTSSTSNARSDCSRSAVKTPACSPYVESVDLRSASSKSANRNSPTSGAKTSCAQTFALRGHVGEHRRSVQRAAEPACRRSAPAPRRRRPRAPTVDAVRLARRRSSGRRRWRDPAGRRPSAPRRARRGAPRSASNDARRARRRVAPRCSSARRSEAAGRRPASAAKSRSAVSSTMTPALPPELQDDLLASRRASFMSQPTADEPVKVSSLKRGVGDEAIAGLRGHRQHADAPRRAAPRSCIDVGRGTARSAVSSSPASARWGCRRRWPGQSCAPTGSAGS